MNKLYHAFCVYNYKGGELYSRTNLTLEKLVEEAIERCFYPGNSYAFNTCSDYKIYETSKNRELKEINPCKIPGFNQLVKDNLIKFVEEYE